MQTNPLSAAMVSSSKPGAKNKKVANGNIQLEESAEVQNPMITTRTRSVSQSLEFANKNRKPPQPAAFNQIDRDDDYDGHEEHDIVGQLSPFDDDDRAMRSRGRSATQTAKLQRAVHEMADAVASTQEMLSSLARQTNTLVHPHSSFM